MGLLGAEPDGGSNLPRLPGFLGRQNKYVRMDDAAVLSHEEHQESGTAAVQAARSRSSTRYVFACSVFASLNSVLLGYGTYVLPPLLRLRQLAVAIAAAVGRIRDAEFILLLGDRTTRPWLISSW